MALPQHSVGSPTLAKSKTPRVGLVPMAIGRSGAVCGHHLNHLRQVLITGILTLPLTNMKVATSWAKFHSFLLLVVRPGATSGVLAPGSDALCY